MVECGTLEATGVCMNRRAVWPVSPLQPRMDPESRFGSFITFQNCHWSSQEAGQLERCSSSEEAKDGNENMIREPDLLEVTQGFHRKVRLNYCTLGEKKNRTKVNFRKNRCETKGKSCFSSSPSPEHHFKSTFACSRTSYYSNSKKFPLFRNLTS